MAISQLSRIQVRSALKANLPQLFRGELGFCLDTQELYIGTGLVSEGAPYQGVLLINGSSSGGGDLTTLPVTPTGTINGNQTTGNRTFTLPTIPTVPGASMLFLGGLKQIYNTDYSISGTTLSYIGVYPPQSGQLHEIYYV